MKQITHLITAIVIAASSFAAGCSSGSSGSSSSDSLAVDSAAIARRQAALRDSLIRDSLMRDSISADSLLRANAPAFSDFFSSQSPIRFASPNAIIAALKEKGFEVKQRNSVQSTYDPDDPEGSNFPTVENFKLQRPDNTTITMLYSEYQHPISIDFPDDRTRDLFMESITDHGFLPDNTGNYVHPTNQSWAGASITPSGRRIVLEWISTN